MDAWRKHWDSDKWREELACGQSAAEANALKRCTHTGRPLGSDGFVSKLEYRLNQRLRPLAIGRPPKAEK